MKKISEEQIEKAIAEHEITRWDVRRCSICNEWTGYVFQDGRIGFDANCGCTRYTSMYEERTAFDLADIFNCQRLPEMQQKLWNDFINAGKV